MALAPEAKLTYQLAGPAGQAAFNSGVQGFEAQSFRGLGVFSSTPYEVSDGARYPSPDTTPSHIHKHTEACRSVFAMQEEVEWRFVPGNKLIQVSSNGDVATWETRNRRWSPAFKPTPSKQGYAYFVHQGKRHPVHQLVALAFIGPPPSKHHSVDHIAKYNGDFVRERSDNRVSNLRYASLEEQRANQVKARARVDARPVFVWRITDGEHTATRFDGVGEAASALSLDTGNLYTVASGKRRSIKGYCAKFEAELTTALVSEDEQFRLVQGFRVSQYGRYKTSRSERIITPMPGKGAVYATVGTNVLFHRLVAEAWPDIVGVQPSEYHNIDHVDQDVTNNNASNLRWSTQSDQLKNQTRKQTHETSSVRKMAVDVLCPGHDWKMFGSMHDAARFMSNELGYKIKDSSISRALNEQPLCYTFKRRRAKGWKIRLSKRDDDKLQYTQQCTPRNSLI